MGGMTEEQFMLLAGFVEARIPDAETCQNEEARRRAVALRLVAMRQISAVRFYRTARPESVAAAELATGSWNLLVQLSQVWREHPDFPSDAAIETFDFDVDDPLGPTS